MPKIEPSKTFFSFQVTRKHGQPYGLGLIWLGKTRFNEYNPLAGHYQRRRSKKGTVFVRMRHMWPPNPQTEAQNIQRDKVRVAVAEWQGLTQEQKDVYNKASKPRNISGYIYFIKQKLLERI